MDGSRFLRRTAVLSFTALGLLSLPVLAGTDSWSVAGSPSGGYVVKLIVDPSTPSTLYVTSNSGVYKSIDSGATWKVVLPRLDLPEDMVIDPLHPATLYVATGASEGPATIIKTTDGGASWSGADDGIGMIEDGSEPDAIYGLSVDPLTEGVVYATSLNTGIYKSTDGGAHWSSIDTGISGLVGNLGALLYPITVDPANPQVLYLPTQVTGPNGGAFSDQALSGIFRSTDGGAHWTQRVDHMGFDRVVVDPSHHTTVYAGGSDLYSSIDGGATWSRVSGSAVPDIIAVDPSDSQHLWGTTFYDGVFESTDGGANWNQTDLGTGIYTASVVMDPATHANLYAATNWGVFKSADSGATWALSNDGLHNVEVDQMLEGNDGIVYLASGGNGIYKSLDQGVTWAEVGSASGPAGSLPVNGDSVYTLVEDPTANATLYAGTNDGIYKTIDGGDTWTETDTGISIPQVLSLAMDPEATSTLYAATSVSGAGVYKSIDGGTTWTASGNGLTISPDGGMQALAVDPHNSTVVYAGAFETGLFKSTDGGATWLPDNQGIGVTDIWSVAVDPTASNVVYTATSNGFFKSTDAGATWTESDNGLNGYFDMTDIQIDAADPSILVVSQRYGTGDSYISPDAGADWFDLAALSSSSAAAKPAQHTTARAPMSYVPPGGDARMPQSKSGKRLVINAAIMDPHHPAQLFGSGDDGQVYSFSIKDLPKVNNTGGSGGTGTGSGGGTPKPPTPSGGGGGNFSLLTGLLLLGLGLRRKR